MKQPYSLHLIIRHFFPERPLKCPHHLCKCLAPGPYLVKMRFILHSVHQEDGVSSVSSSVTSCWWQSHRQGHPTSCAHSQLPSDPSSLPSHPLMRNFTAKWSTKRSPPHSEWIQGRIGRDTERGETSCPSVLLSRCWRPSGTTDRIVHSKTALGKRHSLTPDSNDRVYTKKQVSAQTLGLSGPSFRDGLTS